MRSMMRSFLALLLLAFPTTGYTNTLVADLSMRDISIDHSFNGINVLLFGARNAKGVLVVVVRGPEHDYVVRKKGRILGVWANTESMTLKNMPGFYSIASSQPLDDIKNPEMLDILDVGLANVLPMLEETDAMDTDSLMKRDYFQQAFLNYKTSKQEYVDEPKPVTFLWQTLFKTPIFFPKQIEHGTYTAEVFLFDEGKLVTMQTTPIHIEKTGSAAYVYDFAHEHGVLYGLLCIFAAAFAAWGANLFFRRVL